MPGQAGEGRLVASDVCGMNHDPARSTGQPPDPLGCGQKGRRCVGVPGAEILEQPAEGACAMLEQFRLSLALEEVHRHGDPTAACLRQQAAAKRRGDGVGGVGRDTAGDAGGGQPVEVGGDVAGHGVDGGRAEAEPLAKHAGRRPRAGVGLRRRRGRDLADCRHTACSALCQPTTDGGDGPGFAASSRAGFAGPPRRHHPTDPPRQAANRGQRLGKLRKLEVGVGVDEARQHDRVTEVERLARRSRRPPAADRGHEPAVDHQPRVLDRRPDDRHEPANAKRDAIAIHKRLAGRGHGEVVATGSGVKLGRAAVSADSVTAGSSSNSS